MASKKMYLRIALFAISAMSLSSTYAQTSSTRPSAIEQNPASNTSISARKTLPLPAYLSRAEIYKQMALQSAKDGAEFCQRNALLEHIENTGLWTDYSDLSDAALKKKVQEVDQQASAHIESLNKKEMDGEKLTAQEIGDLLTYLDPWQNTLIPTHAHRIFALSAELNMHSDWRSSVKTMGDLYNHIEQQMSVDEPISEAVKKNIKDNIEDLEKKQLIDGEELSYTISAIACADIGLAQITQCTKTLRETIPTLVPTGRQGVRFSDLQDWKEVMGTDKYNDGIRETAKLIAQRLSGKRSGDAPSNVNIFDDMKSSFMAAQMTEAEAERATLMVMAVIANGGPNTGNRVQELEFSANRDASQPKTFSQKAIALTFIALALTEMDETKIANGANLYSLPKNMKSRCDNGKEYHFWMIARIAQRLISEDHVDSDVAAKVAYTIEKGYQIKRDQGLGISNDAYMQQNLELKSYAPPLQTDRTDMSFAAAGAEFGANFDKQKLLEIDVDSSLPALIKDSAPLAPNTRDEFNTMPMVQKISRWSQIFAPNAAFQNVKNQVDEN